jgi:hypothetical protein
VEPAIVILVVAGVIGWLGGGRRWAFRASLSVVVVGAVGVGAFLVYGQIVHSLNEKNEVSRRRRIHECAIAKVGQERQEELRLVPGTVPSGFVIESTPTEEKEEARKQDARNEADVRAAELDCADRIDGGKSPTEEIEEYLKEHPSKQGK